MYNSFFLQKRLRIKFKKIGKFIRNIFNVLLGPNVLDIRYRTFDMERIDVSLISQSVNLKGIQIIQVTHHGVFHLKPHLPTTINL